MSPALARYAIRIRGHLRATLLSAFPALVFQGALLIALGQDRVVPPGDPALRRAVRAAPCRTSATLFSAAYEAAEAPPIASAALPHA